MKLILIHGRAQEGREAFELETEWKASLTRGFEKSGLVWPDVKIEFPYYANELMRLVNIHNSPLLTHILERGETADPVDDFRAQMLTELASGYGITREQIQAEYGGDTLARAPQNWKWVLATARALDRTPLGERAVDRITRDVSVYLSSNGTRSAIDSIVANVISQEPCVVVAHSLGSVVAYNVVGKTTRAEVRLLATLGSPLGMQSVKEKNGLPVRFPSCVKQWFNARDPKDIVALHPLDDKYFWIRPTIENTSEVANFTANHHSIEGYLEDAAVAAKIHAGLTA